MRGQIRADELVPGDYIMDAGSLALIVSAQRFNVIMIHMLRDGMLRSVEFLPWTQRPIISRGVSPAPV